MALTRITKGVIKPNENYDTHNIVSTGIVTSVGLDVNGNGDISGNLSVGGVITYEDVTSIDSVGIITARNGIDCNGDIDVDGHTNLDNISVAGVTTFSNTVHVGTGITFETNGQSTFSGITTSRGYEVNGYSDGGGNYNYFKAGRLKIYDNGSHIHINGTYSAHLYDHSSVRRILTNNLLIYNTASSRYYIGANNSTGVVDLYYGGLTNHGIKLSTSGIGVTVFGQLDTTDLDVDGHTNLDNVSIAGVTTTSDGIYLRADVLGGSSTKRLYIGASDDLTIFHDTTNSYIQNHTGDLIIGDTNHIYVKGYTSDKSAGLWFNNGEKIRTTNTGVNVSGTVVATGADINGDLDVDGHTNLDNVSIAGITTFSGQGIRIENATNPFIHLKDTTNNTDSYVSTDDGGSLYLKADDNQEGSSSKIVFQVDGSEKIHIESGSGLKFTGKGTSIPVGGILHHTNNNLYVRGGTTGLILGNQDNTTTVQIYNGYIKFETNDGSERLRIDSSGRVMIGDNDTDNAFTGGDDLVIGNTSARAGITLVSSSSQDGGIYFSKGTSSDQVRGQIVYQHDGNGGYMRLYTNAVERIRINQYGGLKLFNASSNISGTDTGALFYNTLEKRVKVYNGNTWTNTDIASDPYWSNVVLLIAGASTITDASGRHTLSLNGNAQTSTTHTSPVGNTHTIRLCSGSSGDYLNVQSNLGDFRLDDSDWTFEYWVRIVDTASGYFHIFTADGQSSRGTFKGYSPSSSITSMYFYSSQGNGISHGTSGNMPHNTWMHVAWEFDDSADDFRLYIGGVLRETNTSMTFQGGNPSYAYFGRNHNNTNESQEFYIDNIRWTRGVCRYNGSNFTPPTSPYPTT